MAHYVIQPRLDELRIGLYEPSGNSLVCVFLTVICITPRIPDRLMEAYTRISLPVNKLNVSSREMTMNLNAVKMKYKTYLFEKINRTRF
jgi:hypothetical protein